MPSTPTSGSASGGVAGSVPGAPTRSRAPATTWCAISLANWSSSPVIAMGRFGRSTTSAPTAAPSSSTTIPAAVTSARFQMPVPRLVVRPRRAAGRDAQCRRGRAVRAGRVPAPSDRRRGLCGVPVHQHGRGAASAARAPDEWRRDASPLSSVTGSMSCASASSSSTRSRRTGRSSSRTTTSACTARPSTRSSSRSCRSTGSVRSGTRRPSTTGT